MEEEVGIGRVRPLLGCYHTCSLHDLGVGVEKGDEGGGDLKSRFSDTSISTSLFIRI